MLNGYSAIPSVLNSILQVPNLHLMFNSQQHNIAQLSFVFSVEVNHVDLVKALHLAVRQHIIAGPQTLKPLVHLFCTKAVSFLHKSTINFSLKQY